MGEELTAAGVSSLQEVRESEAAKREAKRK